ncbi:deoxyribodipyrimidine photolyase [Rheinheimera riviphila]|uniref:Deoxyribodipyrimidine photolyase n=1 Tax=Rheinheimera riviphila TaxID=1834037 RepID=A0A437R5K5_9GAMM|nr:FAD-binding domain-containing protein [Rheinheimera riviphila]RVU41991.1 deoxyribodipyrimidine photolyase [Rheinheimera riviphila]
MTVQVVWFKRDLRIADHRPLLEASQHGSVLCLYVLEDDYWQLAETSNRQWLFVRDSLLDLQQQLAAIGGSLLILRSSVGEALTLLQQKVGTFKLYSHEETGNLWTYQRDIQVAVWCKQQAIAWHQSAQNGVRRPSRKNKSAKSKTKTTDKNADAWHLHWEQWSQQPLLPVPAAVQFANTDEIVAQELVNNGITAKVMAINELPLQICNDEYTCPGRQPGGRQVGLALLDSFLAQRSQRYQSSISSPLTAESGCSRLSAHLAYGTVGLREVLTRLDYTLQHHPDRLWCRNLSAFRSRLVWHCYFIQKLESNPDAGLVNLNRKYDALQRPWDESRFIAWSQGKTGWPLVDACMRYLIYHGWLNFRMRAMLVSVACYTLKLPWQPVSDYLATLFVDFEPGIHYPQIQMQSGTTGQQVLRIYNPVKQAQDLDPEGIFVRRWLPELGQVSNVWIFEPWRMPAQMKLRTGAHGYPLPLVDFVSSHREAKDEISLLRSGVAGKVAKGTAQKTSSRAVVVKPAQNPTAAGHDDFGQLSLFD